MRIHANNLTTQDIHDAARDAGCIAYSVTTHGSRSRGHAFNVKLSGSSFRRTADNSHHAATWDQWGDFLEALFNADESMTVPNAYIDAEHFTWATGGRFSGPYEAHAHHKWGDYSRAGAGNYSILSCDCGAIRRQATSTAVYKAFIAA